MKGFEYYKVTTVAQVISLLTRHGERAALLAGGSDILSMMKDRVEGPKLHLPQHLIDIKGIKALNYIKEQKTGLQIGATTTLNDIASSSLVSGKYPLLAWAASQVAVPQIRNVGTLGGNLCQRPRCWYFRGRLFKDCLRKGGGNCYAQSGENQYHAIFGADVCAMVCPSDTASALTALNARVEIATTKGNRFIPLEQFFMRPEKNILKETVLGPAEMVLAVEIPGPPEGFKGTYVKLKERQAFDFATASVAVGMTLEGNLVSNSRIILGGVASFPFRAANAEAALKGKKIQDAIGGASKAAVEGAQALSNNAYKVKAVKGLIEQALASLA
jgi:xanthine dehydrogenase YagS FAD-binding subunit